MRYDNIQFKTVDPNASAITQLKVFSNICCYHTVPYSSLTDLNLSTTVYPFIAYPIQTSNETLSCTTHVLHVLFKDHFSHYLHTLSREAFGFNAWKKKQKNTLVCCVVDHKHSSEKNINTLRLTVSTRARLGSKLSGTRRTCQCWGKLCWKRRVYVDKCRAWKYQPMKWKIYSHWNLNSFVLGKNIMRDRIFQMNIISYICWMRGEQQIPSTLAKSGRIIFLTSNHDEHSELWIFILLDIEMLVKVFSSD